MKVTADDIAQLLASAPPRLVPAHVAAAATGGGTVWFVPLFGLIFGGFGLIFVTVFFPWRFADDWRLAADGAATTPGVITDVTPTNLSLNRTKVIGYGFRYTVPGDSRARQGRCYTTGRRWPQQAAVSVRYLPAQPDLACVDGARLSETGGTGAFVMIFPLVGGGFIAWFVWDRRQKRRVLREGLVAEADILSIEATATQVNKQRVYRITLAATTFNGGQPVAVRRADPRDVNLARKHANEKQPVFVLYDPQKPARLLFPEAFISP